MPTLIEINRKKERLFFKKTKTKKHNYLQYLLKLNICTLCDLAIPLLGRECKQNMQTYIHQKMCVRMLMETVLIHNGPRSGNY